MSRPECRKISKTYLLGLSDQPFKNEKLTLPPPARRRKTFAELMTTPGAALEWAASDGRKGVSGPPRLTSRNLAKIPSETPKERKTASTVAKKAKDGEEKCDKKDKKSKEKKEKKDEKEDDKKDDKKEEENGWAADGAAWNNSTSEGSKKSKEQHAWGGFDNISENNTAGNDTSSKKDDSWDHDDNKNKDVDAALPWDNPGDSNNTNDTKDDNKANSNDKTNDDKTNDNDKAKDDSSGDFTQEHDDEILKLKTENASLSWDEIAQKIGKGNKESIKARFNKIKPKDWKPAGVGQKQEGGKKNKKNKNNQARREPTEKEDDAGSDGLMGGFGFGLLDDDDNNGGAPNANNPTTNKHKKQHQQHTQHQTPHHQNKQHQYQQQPQNQPQNQFGALDMSALNCKLAAIEAPPGSPNQAHFQPSHAANFSRPIYNIDGNADMPMHPYDVPRDLYPDANFSQDDLRVLALILHQDFKQTWIRIASRFKDKVGRDVHPQLLEEKLCGKVRERHG